MLGIKSVLAMSVLALLLFAGSSPAAAAPAGSTTNAPAKYGGYQVQPGDTLSSIAWHYYGDANAWACIWHANPWIMNPNYLYPGWWIVLPASCSSGGGGTGGSYPSQPMYRTHTVQAGETLSGIACYYYWDCNYWRIYNANRDKLWNPNYVVAGTVLYIP